MRTFPFFTGQLQQQLPLSLHAPHRGQLPDFQRSQILRASDGDEDGQLHVLQRLHAELHDRGEVDANPSSY